MYRIRTVVEDAIHYGCPSWVCVGAAEPNKRTNDDDNDNEKLARVVSHARHYAKRTWSEEWARMGGGALCSDREKKDAWVEIRNRITDAVLLYRIFEGRLLCGCAKWPGPRTDRPTRAPHTHAARIRYAHNFGDLSPNRA